MGALHDDEHRCASDHHGYHGCNRRIGGLHVPRLPLRHLHIRHNGFDGHPGDETVLVVDVLPQRWTLVWRHQLRLASEAGVWKGLRGESVAYAIPAAPEAPEPLPAYLVRFLRDALHLDDSAIAALTREQAQQMLNDYHSRDLREP